MLSLQKLLAVRARTFVLVARCVSCAVLGLTVMLEAAPVKAVEAQLLVDVETGKVLTEQNATMPWYPASVTKLMTTYVTFKALREKRITKDTLFLVSANATAQQPSKMGFKPGTRLTVDNALKMMLVHSANDMAIVLAEGVSGSIENFTTEMNAEAQRLGMTQTNYVNPNGLPDEQQITSARDLAILTRALIHDFPEYDAYFHIASIRLGRRIYRNTNKLIDAYAGSDGMKTGFICASGFNLVASATRNGKRLIAVVLGAKSANGRAVRAAELFERGFGTDVFAMLKPSEGTVETLQPMAATPPDLHDEVCPKDRRHQPVEDGDEGNVAAAPAAAASENGFSLRGLGLPGLSKPQSVLTPGLAAAIPPVDVYTGPPRPPGWKPPPLPPGKKRPGGALAARPPAAKHTPGAKPAPAPKPPAGASASAKPRPHAPPSPKPRTPAPAASQ